MKTFKIYATEVVVYDTKEIEANNLQEACAKYTDLWNTKNEPIVVDSSGFETGEEV
mgnify:CR=1 FL=1